MESALVVLLLVPIAAVLLAQSSILWERLRSGGLGWGGVRFVQLGETQGGNSGEKG